MIIRKLPIPFEDPLRRSQRVLGWIYLLVHVFVLPELLDLYDYFSPDKLSITATQLIYYGVGLVFCLTVMYSFLRGGFDVLADRLPMCLMAMVLGFLIDYALSAAMSLVLALLPELAENPNNEAVLDANAVEGGVRAVVIFLVPIVEEVLFRGVVFGTLRRRSRLLAYAGSAVLFGLYHIWRYALIEPAYFLYALEYVPVSVALAWIYERCGSIWPGIFFHMGINAMSFYVLNLMQNL